MSRSLIFAFATVAFGTAVSPVAAAEPTEKEITDWVAQLDSGKYTEREAAQKKLAGLSTIPPALYEAARSTNIETSRRAKTAIASIEQRQAERRLQQALAAINVDGLDLFVERLMQRPGSVTNDHWLSLIRVAEGLTGRARACGPTGLNLTQDWMSMPERSEVPVLSMRDSRALLKEPVEGRGTITQCFLVCSGPFRRVSSVHNSVLIVLGDIEGFSIIQNSFVLCTGNIGRASSVRDSIVLSRGDFVGSTSAERSLFQVKSIERQSRATGCTYVNLKEVPGAHAAQNNYVNTERGPLDAVQFFDAARLGLGVRQAVTETYVESLKPQSLLESAGARKGDELLSIGGRKWNTAEEFRTALLRAATQDATVLRVRRGDRVVELSVNFRDPPAKK